jgi:muramidase (phage lysozyme)
MTNEEKALLDMIAFAEGTLGISNNGYDVLVGFRTMAGWTRDTNITHKNKEWYVKSLDSTAAGRYQFTYGTWYTVNNKTNPPMTKDNQNAAGVKLLNQRLSGLDKTKFTSYAAFIRALDKLAPEWASIPISRTGKSYYAGDGVNHAKKAEDLFDVYIAALNIYKNK